MVRSNFGAVRLPLLGAAVLASFAVSLSAQVVEKGRTYADLVATHPCNSGNSGRLARVTDAQSSSSIGGGGGSTQVWAVCDGVDTWTLTTIGGGGLPGADQVTESMLKAVNSPTDEYALTYESTTGDFEWQAPSTGDVVGPASATDNCIATFNSTTGKLIQCNSGLTLSDARTIEGSDVTVGNTGSNAAIYMSSDNRVSIYIAASNQIIGWKKNGASDWRTGLRADGSIIWVSSGDPFNTENADVTLFRSAAGVVGVGGTSTTVGAALHLVPLASPPRTCDATAEGDIYSDTSHALCWCDASAWQKLSGAGTCD